jgi:hypothetical protein
MFFKKEVGEGAGSGGRCEAAYSSENHKEETVAKAIGDDDGDIDTRTRISMWKWDGMGKGKEERV